MPVREGKNGKWIVDVRRQGYRFRRMNLESKLLALQLEEMVIEAIKPEFDITH